MTELLVVVPEARGLVNQVCVLSPLQIPYKVVARREGDVAACYANPSLAHEELGWRAALGLDRMCECLWNPGEGGTGYKGNCSGRPQASPDHPCLLR